MSVTELQETISRLTAAQKRAVARYIKYLVADETEERATRNGRLLRKTDSGPRYTLDQVKAMRRRTSRT